MSNSKSLSPPAQLLIEKLTAAQYPSVHPYVFRILVAYIIIYFFILLISILLIFIPFYRGPAARRKHLWLWRRQFATGHKYKTPYYVPNGGIAFVIAQIFGSIAFEIYMLLAYQALKSPEFSRRSYQYFWLAIGNAPGCFGFWYSGFGALYTCIFSPSRSIEQGYRMERYLAHPLIMNTICVGTPIIPTLIALNWGITSIVTEKEKMQAYDTVIFQVLSGIDPKPALAQYTRAGHRFLAQFKWACLSWSIAAILSVVFYSVTLLLFLRLLKKTVDLTTGKKSLLGQADNNNLVVVGTVNVQKDWPPKTLITSRDPLTKPNHNALCGLRLRKSYHLLMWQCVLLMIVSVWYTVDGLVLMVMIESVPTSIGWRYLSAWLVVSSAFLLALALCLQSWRMIADKNDPPPPPSSSSQPHNNNNNNFQPNPKLSLARMESSNTQHTFNVSPH